MTHSIDDIRAATDNLRAARAHNGYALRSERRAAVDLLRTSIEIALPMIAVEATPIIVHHFGGRNGEQDINEEGPRALLIIDDEIVADSSADRSSVHGLCVWLDTNGKLIETQLSGHENRLYNGVVEGAGEWRRTAHSVGLREAVRRYGGENLVQGLYTALTRAAIRHNDEAAQRIANAAKYKSVLSVIKKQCL